MKVWANNEKFETKRNQVYCAISRCDARELTELVHWTVFLHSESICHYGERTWVFHLAIIYHIHKKLNIKHYSCHQVKIKSIPNSTVYDVTDNDSDELYLDHCVMHVCSMAGVSLERNDFQFLKKKLCKNLEFDHNIFELSAGC